VISLGRCSARCKCKAPAKLHPIDGAGGGAAVAKSGPVLFPPSALHPSLFAPKMGVGVGGLSGLHGICRSRRGSSPPPPPPPPAPALATPLGDNDNFLAVCVGGRSGRCRRPGHCPGRCRPSCTDRNCRGSVKPPPPASTIRGGRDQAGGTCRRRPPIPSTHHRDAF
jgi:hypothetical protein